MEGFTLATQPLALFRTLEARGVDAPALFKANGFDPRLFHQPGARVRSEVVARLWMAAVAATGDRCLGLETWRQHHPSTVSGLGYAWLASTNLKEALSRVARYLRVVAGTARATFTETPSGFVLRFEPATVLYCIQDTFFANVVAYCRISRGSGFAPRALALAHPAAHPERYEMLFRCPVTFDAPVSAMTFDPADLLQALPTGNTDVAIAAERSLDGELARIDRNDVVAQLRHRLHQALPSGSPTEETVARALAMSRRTLQRRLADRGTSYAGVLDGTRRDLAVRYLRDPTLQVSEVAYLLGFGEAGSFNRAFKRWTGQTPSDFRAAAAVDTAPPAALQ